MKYIIKESQVERLLKVYDRLMKSEQYEGVCNVMVDYDEMMDKFVLNIMFNKQYIIDIGGGSIQTKHLKRTIEEIGNKFLSFTGSKPLLYEHVSDC